MTLVRPDTAKEIVAILEDTYRGIGPALKFGSVFQLLVAVILSAQTNDNQVNRITEKLFPLYPDAAAFAALAPEELEPLISSCGLYKNKAKNIVAAARIIRDEYGGEVPRTKEELVALPGVGGKTANVVLAVGFGIPALAVDTHVFRVANRLGLAEAKTPEQAEAALTALIPREKWAEAHHWLIWHGRKRCASRKPLCGECPCATLCPYHLEQDAAEKAKNGK
ncbi:MAG: endonuclease III [Firmicutes bacterium]|nr:endonuclease III [Bacillota bacterium]